MNIIIKFLFGILLMILATISFSQNLSNELLERSKSEIKKLKGWSYYAEYSNSPFNTQDTTVSTNKLYFSKNSSDTLLGYNILIKADSVGDFIYCNYLNTIIQYQNKIIYIEDPYLSKKKIYDRFWFRNLIIRPMIEENPYEKILKNTKKVHFNGLKLIEDKICYEIEFRLNVPKQFQSATTTYFIDTLTLLPYSIESNIIYDSLNQYVKLVFRDLKEFDKKQEFYKDIIDKDSTFKRIYYKKQKNKGEFLPLFNLISINGENIDLERKESKIILLDFWFFSCKSCIEAMPHLQKIYDKYSNQGVEVIGLNPIDSKKISADIIKKHLHDKGVLYPNILVDRDFMKLYSVNKLPTLYIINSDGRILEIITGFNLDEFNRIERIIEKQLSN